MLQVSVVGTSTWHNEQRNSRFSHPDSSPGTEGLPTHPRPPQAAYRRRGGWRDQAQPRCHWWFPSWTPGVTKPPLLAVAEATATWIQAACRLGDLSHRQQWGAPTTIMERFQLRGHPELPSGICQFCQLTSTLPSPSPPFPLTYDVMKLKRAKAIAFSFFSLSPLWKVEGRDTSLFRVTNSFPKSGWQGSSSYTSSWLFFFPTPVYFLCPFYPLPLKPFYELSGATWASSKNRNRRSC